MSFPARSRDFCEPLPLGGPWVGDHRRRRRVHPGEGLREVPSFSSVTSFRLSSPGPPRETWKTLGPRERRTRRIFTPRPRPARKGGPGRPDSREEPTTATPRAGRSVPALRLRSGVGSSAGWRRPLPGRLRARRPRRPRRTRRRRRRPPAVPATHAPARRPRLPRPPSAAVLQPAPSDPDPVSLPSVSQVPLTPLTWSTAGDVRVLPPAPYLPDSSPRGLGRREDFPLWTRPPGGQPGIVGDPSAPFECLKKEDRMSSPLRPFTVGPDRFIP